MPRLSHCDVKALESVTERLETLRSEEPSALPGFLTQLRELLDCEDALAYGTRREPDAYLVDRFEYTGDQKSVRQPLERWIASTPINTRAWALFDPSRPEPYQRNRVVEVPTLESLARDSPGSVGDRFRRGWDGRTAAVAANLRRGHEILSPTPIARQRQLRVLVCEGEALLAWVGGFQDGPFDARQKTLFARIAEPLRRRLAIEQKLHQAKWGLDALEVALDELGRAAWVVDGSGVVAFTNAIGRATLVHDRKRAEEQVLRAALHNDVPGFRARRLRSLGSRDHFLVVSTSDAPIQAHLQLLAVKHGVTRRELQVLERLLNGASNKAIAASLACAERTVETHVQRLFSKFDVNSRAKLSACIWTQLRRPS